MTTTLHPIIAIDGPAASGKSTVAKKLAQKLHFVYVDTGAMYRMFTWLALEKGVDPSSREKVKELINENLFESTISGGKTILRANGVDASAHLHESRVNEAVSIIATIPELREFLVNRQRQLRTLAPLVMEGRDIGTVVATDTPYKFFLDADPAIRAERRRDQGEIDNTQKRDEIDRNRSVSPLVPAADAERVDTSKMNVDEVIEFIHQHLFELGLTI